MSPSVPPRPLEGRHVDVVHGRRETWAVGLLEDRRARCHLAQAVEERVLRPRKRQCHPLAAVEAAARAVAPSLRATRAAMDLACQPTRSTGQ